MDDLPELPFEKVLSYLSLEDRLRSRAVSRRWYHKINSFKVKSLCYSERASGFILGKSRFVSGAFARNFISSTRFASFFNTFGYSILSNLKHLRLCDLRLEKESSSFTQTLNSLSRLQELSIIRLNHLPRNPKIQLELSLPTLNSLQLENLDGIDVTLDAPRLKNVNLWNFSSPLKLEIVHGESVERLVTWNTTAITAENLTNFRELKYLCSGDALVIHATFLADLKQLKEIHVNDLQNVTQLFAQKKRNGRVELKIIYHGFLLSCAEDATRLPEFDYENNKTFDYLSENHPRLADELPLNKCIHYTAVESVAPELQKTILSRFNNLDGISVLRPVGDIQGFLDLLKNFANFEHIADLYFWCDQPQDLFDRLPDHSTVQKLAIHAEVSDLQFLFRLKHLIYLYLGFSIDAELIGKLFDSSELQFLSSFEFKYNNKRVEIEVCKLRRFKIAVDGCESNLPDLNSAVQFVNRLSASQSNEKTE